MEQAYRMWVERMSKAIEIELIRKDDVALLRNKVKAFKVALQDLEDTLDLFFEDDKNHCKTNRWVVDNKYGRCEL